MVIKNYVPVGTTVCLTWITNMTSLSVHCTWRSHFLQHSNTQFSCYRMIENNKNYCKYEINLHKTFKKLLFRKNNILKFCLQKPIVSDWTVHNLKLYILTRNKKKIIQIIAYK